MRIVYVLLSSTFGMHQYTADLAHTMVRTGHEVHVVTTDQFQRDRYDPSLPLHTPLSTHGTGFGKAGLRWPQLRAAMRTVDALDPDIVHITGAHLWNLPLLWHLRRRHTPTIHTLHDLDPHPNVRYGRLIRLWTRLAADAADHLLVHGEIYRRRLVAQGRATDTVTTMPILHLFAGHSTTQALERAWPAPIYGRWALFFGRLEPYKGIPDLLSAGGACADRLDGHWLTLAGRGDLQALWRGALPAGVEVYNRQVGDDDGVRLFNECGVVVLPYTGATQSALVAAAYSFGKPVIVAQSGALPEYVQPGKTGWVVPQRDPAALAERLCTALSEPERLAHMGQAGRQWYDEQRRLMPNTLAGAYRQTAVQQPYSERKAFMQAAA